MVWKCNLEHLQGPDQWHGFWAALNYAGSSSATTVDVSCFHCLEVTAEKELAHFAVVKEGATVMSAIFLMWQSLQWTSMTHDTEGDICLHFYCDLVAWCVDDVHSRAGHTQRHAAQVLRHPASRKMQLTRKNWRTLALTLVISVVSRSR